MEDQVAVLPSGLMGTAMIATGTLLYAIKRRKSEHEFGAATARVYRWVEAFNVAALAGIALASIAYFCGNRLPLSLADRSAWKSGSSSPSGEPRWRTHSGVNRAVPGSSSWRRRPCCAWACRS